MDHFQIEVCCHFYPMVQFNIHVALATYWASKNGPSGHKAHLVIKRVPIKLYIKDQNLVLMVES